VSETEANTNVEKLNESEKIEEEGKEEGSTNPIVEKESEA
jgi:hypothetical protein